MSDVVIRVENISKLYRLGEVGTGSLAHDVKRGEVLGIIGRNGAGKSTLLKILSRVTTQSSGQIKVTQADWEAARESRHWGAPRKTAERRLRRRSKVGTL